MDLGLTGRHVLLTGASRGIGRACAEGFAREGARLLLFSRSAGPLEETAAALRTRFSADVEVLAGDMASESDVAALRQVVLRRCDGAPDVLVLNTGRPPLKLREVLDENDPARWTAAHDTQLKGGVQVLATIAPLMVARKRGRIVAITSATVRQPMPRHGLSSVFRAGLTAYLKHLSNEIAHSGVTVNSVCPASIGTEGFLASYNAADRAKSIPLQRLGTPDELAAAVLFYASEQAGFITGTALAVDGGMTASLT